MISYLGWFQLLRDEPPRKPPGFVLPEPLPPVPDAENGLVYLSAEVDKEIWPELENEHREIISWRERWDQEKMQPLVEAAPAIRTIVEKALSYPGWRAESGPGSRSFYKEVELARNLLMTKVRQLSETGNLNEAMDWMDPVAQLSRRLEQTPISLAHVMIGAGISRVTYSTLLRLLTQPGADEALLARGFAMLEFPTARPEDILKGTALDYRRDAGFDPTKNPKLNLSAVFGLIGGKEVPEWLIKSRFKPQTYHNLMSQHLALMEHLCKDTGRSGLRKLRAARDSLEAESKLSVWSFEPNRAGRILAATCHVNFKLAESMLSCGSFRQCCRVAIAAKRWSLAHEGKRVSALTDLVPDYLAAVPLDPYDNQPLKWDAATATVYCIGQDGVDNIPDFKPGEASSFGEMGAGVRFP